MRIAKINSAYIWLICVPGGLQCHTNLYESWAKSLLIWSDFTLGFSKVKRCFNGFGEFFSDGYNCIGSPMRQV